MKRTVVPAVLLLTVATTGCSGMNHTQQWVLSGGTIGAPIGAVGTALTGGCVACGTAIGGAVGAGAGYICDQTRRH